MRYLLAILAVCGVIVASLALHVHYSQGVEICSINSHWDCGTVNKSEFAVIHGVPVAVIGIAGYVALGVLALLRQRAAFTVFAAIGCAFAVHLTLIEKNVLEVWCLYCVISQCIIAVMTALGLGWWLARLRPASAL